MEPFTVRSRSSGPPGPTRPRTARPAAEPRVSSGRSLEKSPLRVRASSSAPAPSGSATRTEPFTVSAAMRGSALIEAGEPARGLQILVAAARGPELPLVPGVWRAVLLEEVTRGWLALRRRREAGHAARRAEQSATALGLKSATALARRARAAVTLAAGDSTTAADVALAAADTADAISAPVEAARARMLAGRALAAAGDRARAVAELQRAACGFDICGAPRRRDEAERALRRLGRRYHRTPNPPRTGNDAAAALTPRELEIAQLVEQRKTNRQIAAQLFLSEKTVETHLRNIFGKLGISTRASITRMLNGEPH